MLGSHFLGFGGEQRRHRVPGGVGGGQGGDPADRYPMMDVGGPPGFEIPPRFPLERGVERSRHPPPSREVLLLVGHFLVGLREAAPILSAAGSLVQSEQVHARQSAGVVRVAAPTQAGQPEIARSREGAPVLGGQQSVSAIQEEPFLKSRVFQTDGGVTVGSASPRETAGGRSSSRALHVDRAVVAVHAGEPGVRGGDGGTAPPVPAAILVVLWGRKWSEKQPNGVREQETETLQVQLHTVFHVKGYCNYVYSSVQLQLTLPGGLPGFDLGPPTEETQAALNNLQHTHTHTHTHTVTHTHTLSHTHTHSLSHTHTHTHTVTHTHTHSLSHTHTHTHKHTHTRLSQE